MDQDEAPAKVAERVVREHRAMLDAPVVRCTCQYLRPHDAQAQDDHLVRLLNEALGQGDTRSEPDQ